MPHARAAILATLATVLVGGVAGCAKPKPLFEISGPRDFLSFEILDAEGAVLWRVESGEPRQVSTLVYGRVPSGFTQSVPQDDRPPRPFRIGEDITTVSLTLRREFRHQAWANGPETVNIRSSAMTLRPVGG